MQKEVNLRTSFRGWLLSACLFCMCISASRTFILCGCFLFGSSFYEQISNMSICAVIIRKNIDNGYTVEYPTDGMSLLTDAVE